MDHFIVRERKDEVFGESIHHSESELVVVVLAVNGVKGHIGKGVVHPAHVPLEIKAKAAVRRGTGNHREGSCFFRNHHYAGIFLVDGGVDIAEHSDGFDVFSSAELVAFPFVFFLSVIAVKH